jgi:hypothetical protein
MEFSDVQAFVEAQLGAPAVRSDVMSAQWTQIEKQLLRVYNRWAGKRVYGTVQIQPGRTEYVMTLDRGPIQVTFVPRTVAPPTLDAYFFGRSYSPIHSLDIATYDMAQHHFAMVRRIIGQEPEWEYDEFAKKLYLHLGGLSDMVAGAIVSESYYVAYVSLANLDTLADLPLRDEDWACRFGLASAKQIVGHARRKFGGGIPGPGGAVQMDGAELIDEGKELEAECLREAQSWNAAFPRIG